MNTETNSSTDPQSDHHTFERVLVHDHENTKHFFNVSENIKLIGGGVRGKVKEVFVEERGKMAMKEYPPKGIHEVSGGADLAMSGHSTLLRILPSSEHELLVQPLFVDSANQRLFVPLLNEEQWVVGTAQNSSKDRSALNENKLPDLQNFEQSVIRLFDALEYVGKNRSVMCADVYFFTIKHSNRQFGYLYGDYEAIHDAREPIHHSHIAPSNVLGATLSLHSFLRECVQNPDVYLKFLHAEASRRLSGYKEIDREIDTTIAILDEEKWPEPNWKEMSTKVLSGMLAWVKQRWETLDKD
jgi:hypothetical protein